MRILNTWKSDKIKKLWYEVNEPFEVLGDFAMYSYHNGSVLYTYKNIAISNLVAANKNLLVAMNEDRYTENERDNFIIDRMRTAKEKGLKLLKV